MLNSLQDNPFLQVSFIQKVVNDVVLSDGDYAAIDEYIPNRDQDPSYGTAVVWDEETYDEGGMTPMVDIQAESPIVTGGGARQLRYSPPHFREKAVLDATDILNLRQLGTQNQQKSMRDLITKWGLRLRRRIDNRRLWNKWQAVQAFAPITLDGAGSSQVLDYSGVGIHDSLGAGAMWDVAGPVPTPLEDLIDFVAMFRSVGTIPRVAFFGSSVMEALLRNDSINTIIEQQIYRTVNPENIYNAIDGAGLITFMERIFAGVKFRYYNAGPIVSLKTVKSVSAGPGACAVAGNLRLFRIGDSVMVKTPNGTKFTTTVTNINIPNATISLAAITTALPRGSLIRKRYEFLDYDKLVFFADMPQGQLGGQIQAEHVSVANIHVDSGLENPQSGIGVRIINHEKNDPPSVEIITSVTEGTVVYHDDGPWSVQKVLT